MATDRQLAVALRYLEGRDDAPRVVARGWGAIAAEILRIAREYDVPVHQDVDLAEVLSRIEVGRFIPQELYQAVAEVLAFLYRTNRLAREKQD